MLQELPNAFRIEGILIFPKDKLMANLGHVIWKMKLYVRVLFFFFLLSTGMVRAKFSQ